MDDYACHNGEAQLLTDQVRALEPGTPAYAYAKGLLCSYCPVGVVSPFRAQQFMAGNGLACYELDAAYDVAAAREALEVDPEPGPAVSRREGFHVVIAVGAYEEIAEPQWARNSMDHLVYRCLLFGKIDRGHGRADYVSDADQHEALPGDSSARWHDRAPPGPLHGY